MLKEENLSKEDAFKILEGIVKRHNELQEYHTSHVYSCSDQEVDEFYFNKKMLALYKRVYKEVLAQI